LLESLGLQRRAREVQTLSAYLASKLDEAEQAKPPHHAQVQPRDDGHRFVKATPVSETIEVTPDEQPAATGTAMPERPSDETTMPEPRP
jgi:hypothetical protein